MTKKTIKNFKYLVVQTDYTDRLIEMIAYIQEQIRSIRDAECECKEQFICSSCYDPILYIRHTNYTFFENGKCKKKKLMYNVSTHTDLINYVKAKVDTKCTMDYIVFRSNYVLDAMGIVNILIKLKYCGMFDIDTMEQITMIDDILMLSFGTESG